MEQEYAVRDPPARKKSCLHRINKPVEYWEQALLQDARQRPVICAKQGDRSIIGWLCWVVRLKE